MSDRAQHILEAMTDGYVALDQNGRCTYVNGVAARLLGASDTLLGKRLHELFPGATPFSEPFERGMTSQRSLTFRADAPALQGGFSVRVSPTEEGSEVFFQDVTDAWRARQDAACLLQLTETLNAAWHLDQVLEAVFQHLRQEAYGVLLALHGPDHGTLDVRSLVEDDGDIVQPDLRVPTQAHLPILDVFRSGELLVLSREACRERYPHLRLAQDTQELAVVPLRSGARTLGVLLLSLRQAGSADRLARSRLTLLAAQCAGAIERVQLHGQAQRREGRYQALLETTGATVWETEGNFQASRPLPSWEALTGQPYEAYQGTGYLDAVHPGDRERVRTELVAGMRAAQPFEMQGQLMTAAGSYRQVVVQAVPVPDRRPDERRDGVQAWTGTIRDVTEERRQQRWEDATRQLLLHLSRAGSAQEVYRSALEEVTRLAGTPRALLAGNVGKGGRLRVLAAQDVPQQLVQHLRQFMLNQNAGLGRKVTQGRPFWLREALKEGQRPSLLTGDLLAGQGEILLVPLRHQDQPTALLALSFPEGSCPAQDVLEHLVWLQPHLAQALQRAQLLYALERSEAQAQAILATLDEGVLLMDVLGRVVSANLTARRLLGLEEEAPLRDAFDPQWNLLDPSGLPLPPEAYPAVRALRTGQAVKDELLRFIQPGGRARWFSVNATPVPEDQGLRGVVISFTDVTEPYLLRQQLEAQAHQDELTCLPNRRVFNQALEQLAPDGQAAILLLDVDQFKLVNDTYGHHMGDTLLRVTAQRLSGHLGGRGVVTRLAGDEYGLILPGVGAQAAARAAQEIVDLLARPVAINEIELHVSACVGLCLSPQDGGSASDLYKHADLALHQAKRSGPGRWYAYTPDLAATHVRRVLVEQRLRRALRDGRLDVHYQPIVKLGAQERRSFEALARWNDPELGWVSPAEFIRVAEEAGLIYTLGSAVLQRALRQSAEWTAQWGGPVTVSVNVSATQLMRPEFPDLVARLLQESGAKAQQLTLEITEAVVMQDVDFVTAQLHALRALGLCVALDDFGTGFSSLSVLGRLPIDMLKVDRAFVRGVYQEPRRQALLSAVVLLGQRLGITVVAEGVEEQRELDVLQGLGCTHVQGYYFARPQPPQAILQPGAPLRATTG